MVTYGRDRSKVVYVEELMGTRRELSLKADIEREYPGNEGEDGCEDFVWYADGRTGGVLQGPNDTGGPNERVFETVELNHALGSRTMTR